MRQCEACPAPTPSSERKLDLPIRPLRRSNRPGAADSYRRVRQSELRMIEPVEELGPELQFARLAELWELLTLDPVSRR